MGLKIFGQNSRNISIGNNAMIPSGAMFIVDAPITIGNNVMFGHNVRKNVPSMEIWAGNPAKKIKERKEIGSYSVYCSTLLV